MDTVVVNHERVWRKHRKETIDTSRSRMRRVLRGLKREVIRDANLTTTQPKQ